MGNKLIKINNRNINTINNKSIKSISIGGEKINACRYKPKEDPSLLPYLTFSSPSSFTLNTVETPNWDGTIEYSTDTTTWTIWDGTLINSENNKLYLRGKGNTRVSVNNGFDGGNPFRLTGENISCDGNIETLLDYEMVMNGEHPPMGNMCFCGLFEGDTSLIKAPKLPILTLTYGCYVDMFAGTSITEPPELLATTLAEGCYEDMFLNCQELRKSPVLPATTLSVACYAYMFAECSKLEVAPELPATTLADVCYFSMFYNCKGLTTLPKLPATILKRSCYEQMFYGCKNIKLSSTQTSEYTIPFRVPDSGVGTNAENATRDMFLNTGGDFVGTIDINTTYYVAPVSPILPYLTFSSPNSFTLKSKSTPNWDGIVEYSTDTVNWTEWDGSLISSINNKLYLRGKNNTIISKGNSFVLTGENISCKGNIETLLDYELVLTNTHPVMGENCFLSLFANNTALISAPDLPATILSEGCYQDMFASCSSLVNVPKLPAINLSGGCYAFMFSYCTSLEIPPELPATTLAVSCYYEMFEGCTSMKVAPALPAKTLSYDCYTSMFADCVSLTTPPELPATTLVEGCYISMFEGCVSLASLPELPATILTDTCYFYMFYGCTNVKLSTTQTSEYSVPYRIPTTGTGTTASNALDGMFDNTGGTFTGTPSINTTYYLATT